MLARLSLGVGLGCRRGDLRVADGKLTLSHVVTADCGEPLAAGRALDPPEGVICVKRGDLLTATSSRGIARGDLVDARGCEDVGDGGVERGDLRVDA